MEQMTMTNVLTIYLGIGALVVAVGNKPWRDKVENAYLFGYVFGSEDSGLTARLIAFTVLLVLACAALWPLYLVVVWADWKRRQPMTDAELDAWVIEREKLDKRSKELREKLGYTEELFKQLRQNKKDRLP